MSLVLTEKINQASLMPFQDLAETERSNDWSGSLRLGVQRWKRSWYLSKVYMGCCTGDVYKQCDLKTSNYNFIYYHLQRFITFDSSIWIDRFLKLKIALGSVNRDQQHIDTRHHIKQFKWQIKDHFIWIVLSVCLLLK